MVFSLTGTFFKYESLTCINYRFNTLPFEPIHCNEIEINVFEIQDVFGMSISPALIACLLFAVFVSLISPFAGFLASGMKRAYNIKILQTQYLDMAAF